jgi:general secretion pathway protein K
MIRIKCLLERDSGIAVVMAVSIMLLLVSVAIELHLSERANLHISAANRDRLTLDQMAESGIHLAMAVLLKDKLESESDSLQEDWADAETLSAFAISEIPFEKGKLEIQVADEMGKIQINALVQYPEGNQPNKNQQILWTRFTTGLLELAEENELLEESGSPLDEDTNPADIVNAIIDWLDSGDGSQGVFDESESDYYKGLDPPYECKNGPFDHLSEVRLVKGITPQLFDGLGGTNGLGGYLTVYGATTAQDDKFQFEGKININTAELAVLAALLPLESAGLAQAMVDFREEKSDDQYSHPLTNLTWYKSVTGMSELTIDPNLITISSDIFRITATATLDDMRSTTVAVVQREKESDSSPWQCKVLNWERN